MHQYFQVFNASSLALIFIVNCAVTYFFWKRVAQYKSSLLDSEEAAPNGAGSPQAQELILRVEDLRNQTDLQVNLRAAHILWTGAWFSWFLGWLAYFGSRNLILTDILDNIGASCLLGFTAVCAVGLKKIQGFVWGISGLLTAVTFFLLLAPTLGLDATPMPDITNLKVVEVQNIVNDRLAHFGPSLCLVISALVLVAWTFASKLKETAWSIAFAILALIYAVFHVGLFQYIFFNPWLLPDRLWKVSFLSCRLGLVWMYVPSLLIAAGVRVRGKAIVWGIGTLGPVAAALLEILLKLLGH